MNEIDLKINRINFIDALKDETIDFIKKYADRIKCRDITGSKVILDFITYEFIKSAIRLSDIKAILIEQFSKKCCLSQSDKDFIVKYTLEHLENERASYLVNIFSHKSSLQELLSPSFQKRVKFQIEDQENIVNRRKSKDIKWRRNSQYFSPNSCVEANNFEEKEFLKHLENQCSDLSHSNNCNDHNDYNKHHGYHKCVDCHKCKDTLEDEPKEEKEEKEGRTLLESLRSLKKNSSCKN